MQVQSFPLTVKPERLSDPVPELVKVTFFAALVVSHLWFPKLRLLGDRDAFGLPEETNRATALPADTSEPPPGF
jgi:hypothetical protein